LHAIRAFGSFSREIRLASYWRQWLLPIKPDGQMTHDHTDCSRPPKPAVTRSSIASQPPLNRTLAETFQFFGSFLRTPARIGSVCPSSPALARAMIEGCHLERASAVVELGPGTGAFTRLIFNHLQPDALFFALELHAPHVISLRHRFPNLQVYNDSAERIGDYLQQHHRTATDCVVSGLPWSNMSRETQRRILTPVARALSNEGVFVSFAYLHTRALRRAALFRQLLNETFEEVRQSSVVWLNVPPAFVYRCRRPRPKTAG
jgi:phospholipid N-methyltransferase